MTLWVVLLLPELPTLVEQIGTLNSYIGNSIKPYMLADAYLVNILFHKLLF